MYTQVPSLNGCANVNIKKQYELRKCQATRR